MKILYGIQCTGNGHITRSIELIEQLRKYVNVDVLTSGTHSELQLPFDVKYKKKGLAYFFGKNGSIDIGRTLRENNLFRFRRELEEVPSHLYNMVISDFEPLSAWSAKQNWVYSVGVSNQVALTHPNIPKPDIVSPFSKLIINNFCPTTRNYGLSYQKLGDGLFYPPIRKNVRKIVPELGDSYVVYLPFYGHDKIIKHLQRFEEEKWIIFSKHTDISFKLGNIRVEAIDDKVFIEALGMAKGVLCSAGFGTTSEALYLGKKMMVIPMKSQYEQQCNAHLLNKLGIPSMPSLKKKYDKQLLNWLNDYTPPQVVIKDESEKLVRKILEDYVKFCDRSKIEIA